MELGFETIGNAALICHDRVPVLVTDPWIKGPAYFGSWILSHEIPERQLEAIRQCEYAWVSHGHPDHLSSESIELLRGKKFLVPNHFGARIYNDLKSQGFDVHTLVDRTWHTLSPRLRVMCIPDVNQDAVLLIELGGRLLVNLNDAGDRGWGRFVRDVIRQYDGVFLMALSGYGDADMINYFDENGAAIPPPAARRTPVGQTISRMADHYGARYFVPFSSMHKYQRKDSAWASQYTTTLADYPRGFSSNRCELLPAFIRYDLATDRLEEIKPRENEVVLRDPEEFGDRWSDPLEPEEVAQLERYFRSIQHLEEAFDFIRFKVGGKEHLIELAQRRFNRGITFEVPRQSLMTAVQYQVFDDLLIGNFMKTTLHGDFGEGKLYPDFSPYVAKYSDNGRARTKEELRNYFRAYRNRDPVGFLRYRLESGAILPMQERSARVLRSVLRPDSQAYRTAKEVFWRAKRAFL